MKNNIKIVLIGLVCIILLYLLLSININNKKSEIQKKFEDINLTVKNIDVQVTPLNSPFIYLNKGQFIYKVELKDKEIWWVRTGVFEDDYIKQE